MSQNETDNCINFCWIGVFDANRFCRGICTGTSQKHICSGLKIEADTGMIATVDMNTRIESGSEADGEAEVGSRKKFWSFATVR